MLGPLCVLGVLVVFSFSTSGLSLSRNVAPAEPLIRAKFRAFAFPLCLSLFDIRNQWGKLAADDASSLQVRQVWRNNVRSRNSRVFIRNGEERADKVTVIREDGCVKVEEGSVHTTCFSSIVFMSSASARTCPRLPLPLRKTLKMPASLSVETRP